MLALVRSMRLSHPGRAVLVLASDPDAKGLARAEALGIATAAADSRVFGKDRAGFEAELLRLLEKQAPDILCLAGFMRVLSGDFVQRYQGRILNIHPSLLPKYPGVDTHNRALAAGDAVHGCTVHQVTAGVDEGPVIGQAEIDVLPGDTETTLAARVLKAEHLLYPRCLAAVARKGGSRVAETVVVDGVEVRLFAPR